MRYSNTRLQFETWSKQFILLITRYLFHRTRCKTKQILPSCQIAGLCQIWLSAVEKGALKVLFIPFLSQRARNAHSPKLALRHVSLSECHIQRRETFRQTTLVKQRSFDLNAEKTDGLNKFFSFLNSKKICVVNLKTVIRKKCLNVQGVSQ